MHIQANKIDLEFCVAYLKIGDSLNICIMLNREGEDGKEVNVKFVV